MKSELLEYIGHTLHNLAHTLLDAAHPRIVPPALSFENQLWAIEAALPEDFPSYANIKLGAKQWSEIDLHYGECTRYLFPSGRVGCFVRSDQADALSITRR